MSSVEERLTRVLGGWSTASVVAGAVLTVPRSTRGFGRQMLTWGLVDGAIACIGARRRASRGPTDPRRLQRVLLVNAVLDVGYLGAGAWLLRSDRWRGDGIGVLVQGGFLLLLDSCAAWQLSDRS